MVVGIAVLVDTRENFKVDAKAAAVVRSVVAAGTAVVVDMREKLKGSDASIVVVARSIAVAGSKADGDNREIFKRTPMLLLLAEPPSLRTYAKRSFFQWGRRHHCCSGKNWRS